MWWIEGVNPGADPVLVGMAAPDCVLPAPLAVMALDCVPR